jgi:hypothetical protein
LQATTCRLWPALVLLLVGCAEADRQNASNLQAGPDPGRWTFTANAPASLPANSATAERTRMDWLSAWMTEARACPGAWKVTSRRVFPQRVVLNAQTDRIVYDVTCLSTT